MRGVVRRRVLRTIRPGDTSKPDPMTIVIVANPALEVPWGSRHFQLDPITTDPAAFQASVDYINAVLFGGLPGQREPFLSDPATQSYIRVASLFVSGLSARHANSLVAEDGRGHILMARWEVIVPFLARYHLQADVYYAITKTSAPLLNLASTWPTQDDHSRPGVAFTLDGTAGVHRFYNRVPGAIALHAAASSLTALHEFGHALSSYGPTDFITDLYVDSPPAVNCKRGRPVPSQFATYNGLPVTADQARDGLGYPAGWQSYHAELHDPAFPAVMDDYWQASTPECCQHDRITRRFLLDRVRAKMSR
jgi:hypothetical protein